MAGGVSFFDNSLDITNPITLGIGSSCNNEWKYRFFKNVF